MSCCTISYNPCAWSAKESRRHSTRKGIIMGYSDNRQGVLVRLPDNECPNLTELADTLWFDASCVTPNA